MRWRALLSLTQTIRKDWRFWRAVYRHERTPWFAKALLWLSVAYILMPFDLVPDFIPVLGQLDDVLIVGGLVLLARVLIPRKVLQECREAYNSSDPPLRENLP